MASIYRPQGSKKYRIAFRDADGKRRTIGAFRDREASKAMARKLEQEAERAMAGLVLSKPKPVAEATEAYIADMQRRGFRKSTWTEAKRLVETCNKECGWTLLSQVRPDTLQSFLVRLGRDGKAPRTQNHYHGQMSAFLNWCIQMGWIVSNPIEGLPKVSVGQAGRRRLRRAYTLDELNRLTFTTPRPRSEIYGIAAWSGLRRAELAALRWTNVDFGKRLWLLDEEGTKSKRTERIPMTEEAAALLPVCRPILLTHGATFNSKILPPIPRHEIFNQDLKNAGIPKVDSLGRHADFHSLRYTFCTLMARLLPIQKVMVLMRHKSILLTANLYLDLGLTDVAEDNWTLPSTKDFLEATSRDQQRKTEAASHQSHGQLQGQGQTEDERSS